MKQPTCLDLDIGNRRIKWRCAGVTGIVSHDQLPAIEEDVHRIRLASVKGEQEMWSIRCREQYGVTPEIAQVNRSLAGVRCGYDDPTKLGIDRWLAVCAAWRDCHDACVVVDAGTALTIDVVQASGQHLGGYIVPGLGSMRTNLWESTEHVKVANPEIASSFEYGRTTAAAVHNGTFRMAIALINQVVASEHAQTSLVYLTGGDAALLEKHIVGEVCLKPFLVLDGLELALPSEHDEHAARGTS